VQMCRLFGVPGDTAEKASQRLSSRVGSGQAIHVTPSLGIYAPIFQPVDVGSPGVLPG
jgi:hypothetical protein